jgi:hypothetical protein
VVCLEKDASRGDSGTSRRIEAFCFRIEIDVGAAGVGFGGKVQCGFHSEERSGEESLFSRAKGKEGFLTSFRMTIAKLFRERLFAEQA